MSTQVKDPFDDLLDMGDGDADSPPPIPSSQPPLSESWMVLPEGSDDFKSVTSDDLFGNPSLTSSASDSKKGENKAHGSTFDDLFGEGTSDKKTKKSSGHGATFEDLFGDDKSSKNFKNGSSTFEELFPEESDTKPTNTAQSKTSPNLDDLFGDLNSKKSDGVLSSKNAVSSLDDLFGTGDKSSHKTSKKTEESLEDIFGSHSAGTKIMDEDSRKAEESMEELFSSSSGKTKMSDSLSKKSDESLEGTFGSSGKSNSKSEDEPKHKANIEVDDLFGQPEKKSCFQKASQGPTFEELFWDGDKKNSEESMDDLFGSTKQKTGMDSPTEKSGKRFDNGFGQLSGPKKGMDELFADNTSSRSVEVKVTSIDRKQKTSSTSSDLDDIFSANTSASKLAADSSLENTRAVVKGSDTVDGTVDILVSPVKDKEKRTSSSDYGDQEGPHNDLDFSVIEDTSLLDPKITRHKSNLRKRGSLARRKKPTRSSMRRVHQQNDDQLSLSPSKDDEDKDEDEKPESPPGRPEREEKEEEAPPPVKRSPVAGGKLLIGPDVLAQAKLLKSKRGQASAVTKTDSEIANGAASNTESDRSEVTHKPVIKPSKPQISPRPKLSPTSDSTEDGKKRRSQDSKPDVVPVTPSSTRLATDNKETEKNTAFPTVMKPTSTNVPPPSSNKLPSVTLEKVALRSTRSGSSPPEPNVTSASSENNVIHSELAERKNSLRRVSPAKNKECDEPKEEKKSQPTWLREMKLRNTPRNTPDVASSKVADSKSRSTLKDESDKLSSNKPTITPRFRDVDSPKVSENKPQPLRRPVIDRPKPKVEAVKPALSVNGKGDAPSRSPLGVKEINTSSTDMPSWKRELAERKKKKKDEPLQSTPPKSDQPADVATNWRTQLQQKKRRPVQSPGGDVKASPDSKQPEWAIQAEQRRARLVKSGILGQK